jgi:succinyl-diaminopimelate desuccinylase
MTAIDLDADIVSLTASLIDIASVSHHEQQLADAVQAALAKVSALELTRCGNSLVARTTRGADERVLLGGHLDTVPPADNLPHRIEGGTLYGLGSVDMSGGVASMLHLASLLSDDGVRVLGNRDLTFVFYECEEVASEFNGLERILRERRELLDCTAAVLLEPTGGLVEAGCQGTLRAEVAVSGRRAHSARSWLGVNAIHGAREVLERLERYEARRPLIDGLEFREGLNAVGITGGVAGNVIPDSCIVTVNFRFAPDRSVVQAEEHLREVFDGYDVTVVDAAPGAMPGLRLDVITDVIAKVGELPRAKLGWTDVARFSALGTPALNFGPGDPALAHAAAEGVPIAQLSTCADILRDWLFTQRA